MTKPNRYPSRRIVDTRAERYPDGSEIDYDILECGHETAVRYNAAGRPASGFTRRKCRRCAYADQAAA
jgi:hypothetical protein